MNFKRPDLCRYTKRAVGLMLIFTLFQPAAAVPMPDHLQSVGSARLKVLWFEIYDAQLFNVGGRYEGIEGPMLLQLTYKRYISKDALVKETGKQLAASYRNRQAELATRLSELDAIWRDVREGESISFFLDAQSFGHFYLNQEYIGSIRDRAFSTAFINIWLAKDSDYPKMSRQLRGES